MKLTVLIENTSNDARLVPEHGLSVLVENGGNAMLFDTGDSGRFVDNAKTLGKDLGRVRAVALSHNHYDHTRGYLRFAEEFGMSHTLYLSSRFFKTCMWDGGDELGGYLIPTTGPLGAEKLSEMRADYRLIYRDIHPVEELEGAFLVNNLERLCGFERPDETNFVYEAGELKTDLYRDEQALALRTERGLCILTGCAHTGVCSIIETVRKRFPGEKIAAVLGGTHLVACDDDRIEKTAEYLKNSGIQFIGGCHCTGERGLCAFAQRGFATPGCGFTLEV